MKTKLVVIALVAGLIIIGLINRENATRNTEAIEALPEPSTENNIPLTAEELRAQQENQ